MRSEFVHSGFECCEIHIGEDVAVDDHKALLQVRTSVAQPASCAEYGGSLYQQVEGHALLIDPLLDVLGEVVGIDDRRLKAVRSQQREAVVCDRLSADGNEGLWPVLRQWTHAGAESGGEKKGWSSHAASAVSSA